jgi:hypothetical protein
LIRWKEVSKFLFLLQGVFWARSGAAFGRDFYDPFEPEK